MSNENFTMENFTMANLYAGLIGAIVENKPVAEALKEVGLSEPEVINKLLAPQSSSVGKQYVKETIEEEFFKVKREKDSDLYVVKKVLCEIDDYEKMAEVISNKNTDKFKILRLISSNSQIIAYKQKNPGLEAYLVSGKTPIEALRKTTSENPILQFYDTDFSAEEAKEIDRLFTNAIYNHTPKSIQKAFDRVWSI